MQHLCASTSLAGPTGRRVGHPKRTCAIRTDMATVCPVLHSGAKPRAAISVTTPCAGAGCLGHRRIAAEPKVSSAMDGPHRRAAIGQLFSCHPWGSDAPARGAGALHRPRAIEAVSRVMSRQSQGSVGAMSSSTLHRWQKCCTISGTRARRARCRWKTGQHECGESSRYSA